MAEAELNIIININKQINNNMGWMESASITPPSSDLLPPIVEVLRLDLGCRGLELDPEIDLDWIGSWIRVWILV